VRPSVLQVWVVKPWVVPGANATLQKRFNKGLKVRMGDKVQLSWEGEFGIHNVATMKKPQGVPELRHQRNKKTTEGTRRGSTLQASSPGHVLLCLRRLQPPRPAPTLPGRPEDYCHCKVEQQAIVL